MAGSKSKKKDKKEIEARRKRITLVIILATVLLTAVTVLTVVLCSKDTGSLSMQKFKDAADKMQIDGTGVSVYVYTDDALLKTKETMMPDIEGELVAGIFVSKNGKGAYVFEFSEAHDTEARYNNIKENLTPDGCVYKEGNFLIWGNEIIAEPLFKAAMGEE